METTAISAIEVQKELMKNKVMAKLSHYTSGNLYYTVEVFGGTYQFPISTVDTINLNDKPLKTKGEMKEKIDIEIAYHYNDAETLYTYDDDKKMYVEATCKELSADLGTTTFSSEIKGSELNRWIKKAISNNEFIKIG